MAQQGPSIPQDGQTTIPIMSNASGASRLMLDHSSSLASLVSVLRVEDLIADMIG